MKYLPDASQMKEADRHMIQQCHVTSMELMERAAAGCVEYIEKSGAGLGRVCVVCGTGNNGGDGVAIARMLTKRGLDIQTVLVGERKKCTVETKNQLDLLTGAGGTVSNSFKAGEYSIIVDALFGVGLSRDIEGEYETVIEQMNASAGFKIAVDIPSGISADSGSIMGIAFQADATVTFQAGKLGPMLYPGREYAGEIIVKDIGIGDESFLKNTDVICRYEAEEYRQMVPPRRKDSNKGTYGKVLCISGSRGMAGAAYLNAKAAYRVGAGLVRIYTSEDNRVILQQLLPEAVITTYDFYDEAELLKLLRWADVVSIGSGIGTSEKAKKILKTTLENTEVPCVVDADGLNLIADHRKYLRYLDAGRFILTPHMGEMARLLKCSVQELRQSRIPMLSQFVEECGAVCVLKDARSIVMAPGERPCMNPTGSSAMAKGGSGDVLTGVIAGFLAQKASLYHACVAGAYVHGLAGDYAKAQRSSYSVLAEDILEALCIAMKEQER